MDGEYLAPPVFVGDADDNLAVETAGTSQCLVNSLGPVGGRDHHKIGARFQPVHQRKQLCDQPLFGFALHLVALWRNRIDLVDKQDRRRSLSRRLKHFAQLFFRFAVSGTHNFGAVDQEKLGFAFVRNRARQPCLAGARRPVQQNPARRIDA